MLLFFRSGRLGLAPSTTSFGGSSGPCPRPMSDGPARNRTESVVRLPGYSRNAPLGTAQTLVSFAPASGVFCPLLLRSLTRLSLSFAFLFLLSLSSFMHEAQPLTPLRGVAALRFPWMVGRAANARAYSPTIQAGNTRRALPAWHRRCGQRGDGACPPRAYPDRRRRIGVASGRSCSRGS